MSLDVSERPHAGVERLHRRTFWQGIGIGTAKRSSCDCVLDSGLTKGTV